MQSRAGARRWCYQPYNNCWFCLCFLSFNPLSQFFSKPKFHIKYHKIKNSVFDSFRVLCACYFYRPGQNLSSMMGCQGGGKRRWKKKVESG